MRRYLIVCSGYNAGATLVNNLCRSLFDLKGDHDWTAVLISDGSTDEETNEVLKAIDHERIRYEVYTENLGATYRRHQAIMSAGLSDTDVVIFVGLDDELMPEALNKISEQYDKGMWMTYGNWIDQRGKGLPDRFPLHFPSGVHRRNAYRQVPYRSTAANTFLFALYKRIPEGRLKLNGKWFDTTTESEVMFCCLEMSGPTRQGIIYEPIYLYNRRLPGGTLCRLGADYKKRVYNQVIARLPMARISEI